MRSIVVVLALGGCVVDGAVETGDVTAEESGEVASDDFAEIATTDRAPELATTERIALNGLTLNRALLGTIATGSLASAATRVPALFDTADGREQFSYLVSCALGSGKSVVARGVTYQGSVGIASGWQTSALSTANYKWVSACVLARTNLYGVSVNISLRGTVVSVTPSELLAYTLVEGAFWGDIFTAGAAIRACASPLKLSGSVLSTLAQRECAVSLDGVVTKCGFSYAGDCSKVCTTHIDGSYRNCGGVAETLTTVLAKP